MILLITVIEVK